MKRFDIAVEISKQLIAIALAVLVGIAALTSSIIENEGDARVFKCLVFLYIFLGLSIISGIVHLGAIVNSVETAEKRQFDCKQGETKEFVSTFDNKVAIIGCAVQQLFFAISIVLLVITLLIDRSI